jgi:hypothetical protein
MYTIDNIAYSGEISKDDYEKCFVEMGKPYQSFDSIDNSTGTEPGPTDGRGPMVEELSLPERVVKEFYGVAGFSAEGKPVLYDLVQVDGETETITVHPSPEKPVIFIPGKGYERL